MKQNRKEFLKKFGWIAAGVCCAPAIFSLKGCVSAKTVAGDYENGKLKVNKDAFADTETVVVTHLSLPAPVLLQKNGQGYKAVLMLCTHKACELEQSGTVLVCPCHGSEFSLNGKVLAPPATEDLKEFTTSEEGNTIIIHL